MSFEEELTETPQLLYSLGLKYGLVDADEPSRLMTVVVKAVESGDVDTALLLLHAALRNSYNLMGFLHPIDRPVTGLHILRGRDVEAIGIRPPLPPDRVHTIVITYRAPDGRGLSLGWYLAYIPKRKAFFATPMPLEDLQRLVEHLKRQASGSEALGHSRGGEEQGLGPREEGDWEDQHLDEDEEV